MIEKVMWIRERVISAMHKECWCVGLTVRQATQSLHNFLTTL